MPDYGLDRCDGHHEMVDFRLRKIGARRYQDNKESPGIRRGFEFRDETHPEEGDETSRQPDSIPKRETRNEKRLRNAAIAFSYRCRVNKEHDVP